MTARMTSVQPVEGVADGVAIPVSVSTLADGSAKTQVVGSTGNIAAVLGASTTPVAADKALVVAVTPNSPSVGAKYSSTALLRSELLNGPTEVSRIGNTHIAADLYDFVHQTHLAVAGSYTGTGPLTYPCDGIRTDLDGAVVYMQPRGRPWMIVDGNTFDDATKWSGANWTVSGNKATHTAGATTALTATGHADRPIVVGKRYATKVKISGRTAGSVTVYIGTAAGTARSADGTFVEVITAATTNVVTVVPSNDFDGSIEILQVYIRSPKLTANAYEPFAAAEIVGIAASTAMSTLLAASDTVEVFALYRRYPGFTDLG